MIDSDSTDNTVSLARKAGAKVYHNPWPGYGPQKNYGLELARGNWALFIDADEEVTPKLAQEIKSTINQWNDNTKEPKYFWFKIVTIFLGKPLNHLYGHNLRLFKKGTAKWTDAKVHEQVVRVNNETMEQFNNSTINLNDTDTTILSNPLLHHSHVTISSYLKKMHHYTSLDAEEMAQTDRHRSGRTMSASWTLPWHLSARQFIKLYLYRKGILDGYAGLMWSLLSSYYEFEMAQKYLKNNKDQST